MTDRSSYQTKGGIVVHREVTNVPVAGAVEPLLDALDSRRGVVLASSYEYPGRYTRFDMGFVDPPLVLTARGHDFTVASLNDRGRVLLPAIERTISEQPAVADLETGRLGSLARCLDLLRHRRDVLRELTLDGAGNGRCENFRRRRSRRSLHRRRMLARCSRHPCRCNR